MFAYMTCTEIVEPAVQTAVAGSPHQVNAHSSQSNTTQEEMKIPTAM